MFDQDMAGLILFFDEKFGLVSFIIIFDVFFINFDLVLHHGRSQLDVLHLDSFRHLKSLFVRLEKLPDFLICGLCGGFEVIF